MCCFLYFTISQVFPPNHCSDTNTTLSNKLTKQMSNHCESCVDTALTQAPPQCRHVTHLRVPAMTSLFLNPHLFCFFGQTFTHCFSARRVWETYQHASGWTSGRNSHKSMDPLSYVLYSHILGLGYKQWVGIPYLTVSLCVCVVCGVQVCVPVQPLSPAQGVGGVWLYQ